MGIATQKVPIPAPAINRRRKYPLDTMGIGEMFFLPDRTSNNVVQYISGEGPKLGRRFKTRLCWMKETIQGWQPCDAQDPAAVKGIGVWRHA